MNRQKRKRLEAARWKTGDTKDFLGLSDPEAALVEVRLSLARHLKQQRRSKRISQAKLADRVGSSQSRVAKMEAGDASVSIDLLIRTLLKSGSTPAEIGRVIANGA